VWWTAETWYSDEAEHVIAQSGGKSVLYVMPELHLGSDADVLWNPTPYLNDRVGAEVMDWPCVPPPRWEARTAVRRVLHISGGAQYDRNGTDLFVEALRRVREPVDVLLHQPDVTNRTPLRALRGLPSHVHVRTSRDYATSMSSLYKWADLLVLPRRYAGLCLPAFEAFGHGCLVMMPDVDPQAGWPIVGVEAVRERPVRMRGGRVPMWSVDPVLLARRLDGWLTADPRPVVNASEAGRAFVEARSWERMAPVWRERLEALCD
jgi:glycosyltransferase involved in cell wall biosynthesis